MLDNVKSLYILKIFFSFVDEKRKLKLVKYNKNLQQKIDISISNFIHLQLKYIIYKSMGKGEEYDYGHDLKFEGEHVNGERIGKGNEYYNDGKLEFIGEYLNDKRNGEDKDYNDTVI